MRHSLPGAQPRQQHEAMAGRLPFVAEERDGARACLQVTQNGQGLNGFTAGGQLSLVRAFKGEPGERAGIEAAEKIWSRSQLFQPEIYPIQTHSPRPGTHDQDAEPLLR